MVLPLRSLQLRIVLAATTRNGALDAAPATIRIGAPRKMARRDWSVAACAMLREPAASCCSTPTAEPATNVSTFRSSTS
jgi:hypothetical protein